MSARRTPFSLALLSGILSILLCTGYQLVAQQTSSTIEGGASESSLVEGKEAGETPEPSYSESLMKEGKKFLKDGLYLESADLFETVLSDPGARESWPEATLLAGKAYLEASRSVHASELRKKAIEMFQSFTKNYDDSPLLEEVTFLWGLTLFEADDYFEAEPRFNVLLTRFPDGEFVPETDYYLARIMEASQRYLEAQQKYYRVIEFHRRPADRVEDATFRLGKISTLLSKYDLAVRWYEIACKQNQQRCLMDADVLFSRGIAHSALKDHQNAIKNLQRFVNLFPDDPRFEEAMLALAKNLSETGEMTGAVAVLETVTKSGNQEARAEAMLRLATLEHETEQKLTAEGFLALYERVVEIAPYSSQAMTASIRIAKHLLKSHDYENSLHYLDWFFNTYEENKLTDEALDLRDSAIVGQIQTQLDQNEFFDAAITFENRNDQIKKQSALSQASFLAGQAYFGLMGYEKGASLLKAADEKHLSDEQRRRKRLLLAIQANLTGDSEKAVSELKSLSTSEKDKTSILASCHLVDILLKKGSVKDALEAYGQMPPDYCEVRLLLTIDFRAGRALYADKQFAKAADAFDLYVKHNLHHRMLVAPLAKDDEAPVGTSTATKTKILALDCDSHLATFSFLMKAKCLAGLGRVDNAAQVLQEVIDGCETSPFVHEARFLLADYKAKQGKSNEAIELLKQVEGTDAGESMYGEAEPLLLAEMEAKKRLYDVSSWWKED